MRRQFVALIVSASAGLALAFIASLGFALTMSSCYVSWIPLPERPMCGSRIWGHWLVPIVLLILSVGILIGSASLGIWMFGRQLAGARAFRKQLGAVMPPSAVLIDALGSVDPALVCCVRSSVPLASTVGLFRPRIVVTDSLVRLLTNEELRAVLTHEQVHLRQRHPIIYASARAAARAGFVMPALGAMADRVVLESELQADAAAIQTCGRAPLAGALTKLLHVRVPAHEALAVGSVSGMLDERIQVLAGAQSGRSSPHEGVGVVSVFGVILLALPPLFLLAVFLRSIGFSPW